MGSARSRDWSKDRGENTNTVLRDIHRPALTWWDAKTSTRSMQDRQAVALLEAETVRLKIDGVNRYATPLLRIANMPSLWPPYKG